MPSRRKWEWRSCVICGHWFPIELSAAATTCSAPCKYKLRSQRHPSAAVQAFGARYVEPVGDGCSGWTGDRDPSGYATFRAPVRGHERLLYAHHFVWERRNGPIADGAIVHHLCAGGTEGCARYEHLALADDPEQAPDAPHPWRSQRPLSAESARGIRDLWHDGNVTIKDLETRFNATEMTIRNVLTGKSWPSAGGPIAHFERPRGERFWNARLTADAVRLIRRQFAEGMSLDEIAAYHRISKSAVSLIVRRKRWAHV
jgi:hypothetical protein